MVVWKEISVLINKIKKGLMSIPSSKCSYKNKKYREMEIKELFRACCYMIVEEQTCSKTQIQRRFNINYTDATFVFDMLLENNLISPVYKSNISNLTQMEKILDKIYK